MWWDDVAQDVRYAARSWRAAPGLAFVAALTMVLGIVRSTRVRQPCFGDVHANGASGSPA